jgi:hypothetical protein
MGRNRCLNAQKRGETKSVSYGEWECTDVAQCHGLKPGKTGKCLQVLMGCFSFSHAFVVTVESRAEPHLVMCFEHVQSSLRDEVAPLIALPALKDRAKIKPPLRGEEPTSAFTETQEFFHTLSRRGYLQGTRRFRRLGLRPRRADHTVVLHATPQSGTGTA